MGKRITNERLSSTEFRLIEKFMRESKGIREIAGLLDRSPSSISRQVKNPHNLEKVTRYKKEELRFSAKKAIANQALNKRGRGAIPKVYKDPKLRAYLETKIKAGWSPQIALGRAAQQEMIFSERISVKTVYNSIYRRDLDVSLFDLHLKLRRSPNRERIVREHKKHLGKRIDERPDIADRKEFGHFEGDSILWGRECAVLVLVERKVRYVKLRKLDAHTALEVNKKIESLTGGMETLTVDNGSEFAGLAEIFPKTYFTHPYSAWEKGSVENMNHLIRRYLPRNTPIDQITQQKLDETADKINNLPRPILDFYTANELYSKYAT